MTVELNFECPVQCSQSSWEQYPTLVLGYVMISKHTWYVCLKELHRTLCKALENASSTPDTDFLSTFEAGQETSACQIWGHSFHAFSESSRNPKILPVNKVKIMPKLI